MSGCGWRMHGYNCILTYSIRGSLIFPSAVPHCGDAVDKLEDDFLFIFNEGQWTRNVEIRTCKLEEDFILFYFL